jgi:hypothetical protein
MIDIVLTILMFWAIIGFSSSFVNLFVFFRGMEHMIQCHLCHKDEVTKKIGHHMLKQYTEYGFGFYMLFFFIYTCLGPITVLVLISDFFKFTFNEK